MNFMIYMNNTTHLLLPSRDRKCGLSAGGSGCRQAGTKSSSANMGCSRMKARSTCDRHQRNLGWRRDLPRLVPRNCRNLPWSRVYTLPVSRDRLNCWRCSRRLRMLPAKHPSRPPLPPPRRTRSGRRSPWSSLVSCLTNYNWRNSADCLWTRSRVCMPPRRRRRMGSLVVVALGAGNDGGGADWRRTVTFLNLRGRTCRQRRLPRFGHGDERLSPSWHSDGDGPRRSRFVRNKSS